MSYDVEFRNVTKKFGSFFAVDDLSFGIKRGEFFSMLGPSGSGKTTCLRMVAGFQEASLGHVFLEDKDVTGVPPYLRNVNTVFQDYALFPHLNVEENVGYGLKIKKLSSSEIKTRIAEMLEMVRLPDAGKRKPSELSGGQRQRIALARALINRPGVLLLDEPLGALDLKLREEMQIELKSIQKKIGITFVFVTHDQEEALSMSDRIAIFNKGKVEQIGTPSEVYEKPKTEFVANFVGISNLLKGEEFKSLLGKSENAMIRPEKMYVLEPSSTKEDLVTVDAFFKNHIYSGATSRLLFETRSGQNLIVFHQNQKTAVGDLSFGKEFLLGWKKSDMHFF